MVIYQKGKTPFILRFLTVFISPGTWILSGFGAVIFYFAGTEKPPMSTGMYIVAGIVALLVYGIMHAHWVEAATKLVLIEIVPSGLRIQQLKYDTLHEVIIEATQLDLAATRYRYTRRNQNTQCTLIISNKDETHSFTVWGDEELIGQMLEKISEQKVIELLANENDFITRYKENVNSVSTKVANVIVYGVRTALVVGIVIGGYTAYQSYVEGGFMSELVNAIRHYQNEDATSENNSEAYQSLVDFPRKWFPLFESEDGLVRQQLCGSEAHIEIFERDGGDIWSEHGYQDMLEGAIVDFITEGDGKYILTIQLERGNRRQITILTVDQDNEIYTIDEKTYTSNPDSFVIENDTEECL
ncbi:MAG: hypothetical protein KF860_12405 [Cyclobacteriaceae bacterium]|nr:hypothetical protein [Cyclobacteriaceae bacterium]